MSTNDVPGAKANNKDVLAMGCWAEHKDGSLILVLSTEGGKVVYEIFELAGDVKYGYKHAMPELQFKKNFSYDSTTKGDKWTWHDKTPFPWERVMKEVTSPIPEHVSAADRVSAAQRVIDSLRKRGEKVEGERLSAESLEHLVDTESYPASNRIMRGLAAALNAFADELKQ